MKICAFCSMHKSKTINYLRQNVNIRNARLMDLPAMSRTFNLHESHQKKNHFLNGRSCGYVVLFFGMLLLNKDDLVQ